MMEIRLTYPTDEQEQEIVLKTTGRSVPLPAAAFDKQTFLELREIVRGPRAATSGSRCSTTVPIEPARGCAIEPVRQRLCELGSWAARLAESGAGGQSPGLLLGRTAPTVEDIAAIALPVLRHRIIPNHRAVGDRITTDQIIERLLKDAQ